MAYSAHPELVPDAGWLIPLILNGLPDAGWLIPLILNLLKGGRMDFPLILNWLQDRRMAFSAHPELVEGRAEKATKIQSG